MRHFEYYDVIEPVPFDWDLSPSDGTPNPDPEYTMAHRRVTAEEMKTIQARWDREAVEANG